jgi:lactate dehydrogenase-like 2-hydroxyacid dehydrogenase
MNRIPLAQTSGLPPYLSAGLEARYEAHPLETLDAQGRAVVRATVGGGESRIDRNVIASLPALELIAVCGVGYDGVDVEAARERGIAVTNTPSVLDDDVADLALGLMLSVARRIPQADAFVRRGEWERGAFPLTRKLSRARLGLLGLGRIGQAIADRASAFGMSIGYHTRTPRPEVPYKWHSSPASLAADVDFLVVITPGGAATRGLVDAAVLKALGPEGYLVNVARGSVVDEAALVSALTDGTIAGAGLDVFSDEPHVSEALRALDNVVLTPHVGSGTGETRRAMSELTLANLDAWFSGKPLVTPVI